jgi:hypothetical protein
MAKGASQTPSASADAPRYYVRRGGWQYLGHQLDRGQVLQLSGAQNDEKLVRLGYVALLESRAERYRCSECGEEFVGIAERTAHGDDRHRERYLTPEEEDAREERRERMQEQVAPLYLDKTKAAQSAA